MEEALIEAESAFRDGEVPVGAVVVRDGEVIGRGANLTISLNDPTAHAEIVAIRDACQTIGDRLLTGCDLYVTLEPCPMCAGAILLSRLRGLYFGAYDMKAGATGTLYSLTTDERFNHTCRTLGGIMDIESATLLRSFFEDRRH